MADALSSHELHVQWAKVRDEARQLIEEKPWLNRPDWAAGRITHHPHSVSPISDLGIAICVLLVIITASAAYVQHAWQPLVATVVFLIPAAVLIRRKASYGKSECLLRSIPGRIGGTFEGDIKVRLGARPDARVRASLANFSDHVRHPIRYWSAEQSVGREEIRIATDGTWTIPVRISIPPAVRAKQLGPVWLLDVHVETAGPDYWARFVVPVFDLADLRYDEDPAQRERAAPYAKYGFRGSDIGYGLLVGALTGFALGFSATGHGGLKGLFAAPFFAAVFAFMALGHWRGAVAVTLRDRDLAEKAAEMRLRLMLLRLAPWIAAAIVLWFAWQVLPLAGWAWGIGMMLCAHPSPFGRFWRDPLFQSGAALTFGTLLMRA